MESEKTLVGKLAELKAGPRTRHRRLSLDDGRAILDAFNRGVPIMDLVGAVGLTRTNLYFKLGTWAINHCQCWREEEEGKGKE